MLNKGRGDDLGKVIPPFGTGTLRELAVSFPDPAGGIHIFHSCPSIESKLGKTTVFPFEGSNQRGAIFAILRVVDIYPRIKLVGIAVMDRKLMGYLVESERNLTDSIKISQSQHAVSERDIWIANVKHVGLLFR